MNAERWRRVTELFWKATELSPAERATLLASTRATDPALATEVERLIEEDGRHDSVLDAPAVVEAPATDAGDGVMPRDEYAGPYRLVERIASGGMGDVYRATRADGEFKHDVAVKLVRLDVTSADLLRRFQVERQTLATLEHPNIARLLDGGTTKSGRPYLVMEFVDGRPIDEFCDERTLTIADRLRLFVTVCRAVHAAHQNLVVHRDLKPSNILVTSDGTPKLLDFGIAKVMHLGDENEAERTRTDRRLLTPDYASPEQIRGEPVTIETDVYSLGVILFRLLTGRRPYRLTTTVPNAIERAVCDQTPARPSAVLTGAADGDAPTLALDEIAARRRLSTERLRRTMRGDLDTMVLMALRKEPARRYASALQFAEDIERYLAGHPVVARPDTLFYRTAKFVRRNPIGVTSAVGFVVVLCAAIVVLAHLSRVADRERNAAIVAERDARAQAAHAMIEAESFSRAAEFLTDAFLIAKPTRTPDELRAAQQHLSLEVTRLHHEYEGRPHLQANLLDALGRVYLGLDLYDEARSLLEEAASLRQATFGEESLEFALSLNSLGELLMTQGKLAEAEDRFRRCLDLHERLPRGVHTDVATAANNLATCLRNLGKLDEAQALHERALALRREIDPVAPVVAESLNNLGGVFLMKREPAKAVPLFREALTIRQAKLGPDHGLVTQSMGNLAVSLVQIDALEESEALYADVLVRLRRSAVVDELGLAAALTSHAEILRRRERFDEARGELEEALAIRVRKLGPDHIRLSSVHDELGYLERTRKRDDVAIGHWNEALRIRRASLPEGSPAIATTLVHLATSLMAAGRNADAIGPLEEAVRIYEAAPRPDKKLIVDAGMRLSKAKAAIGSTATQPK